LKIKNLKDAQNQRKSLYGFARFLREKTTVKTLTIGDARNFICWKLNGKWKNKKKGASVSTANMYLHLARGILNL